MAQAGEKRAMTFEDMFTMTRVSQLVLSPEGDRALCRIQKADIDTNKMHSRIYLVDLATGQLKAMTPAGESHSSPAWHPNGQAYAYSAGGKIFVKALDGSAPYQVTEESGSGAVFSPDGKAIVFIGSVQVADYGDHSGKVIDELMYRHWNAWTDDERTHLFMAENMPNAESRDLTPDASWVPPISLGTAHDYAFSPDGKELAYVTNPDEVVATSTNNDVFVLDLATNTHRAITTNQGGDAGPVYSPNGRYIAYESMARAGFEADQSVIWIYDRKAQTAKQLSTEFTYSAHELVWAPDSKSVVFTAQVWGSKSVYQMDLNGKTKRLTKGFTDSSPALSADGKKLYFLRQATHMPSEIFSLDMKSDKVTQLTFFNRDALAQLDMNPWEEFTFSSPNGDLVQGFVIKPPGFDESKKYPMIYLIHGGPQGMWSNQFHYRWNAQMFAAPGYVAVMVNPHGSKGYGQPFCDAVSKDWGGLPYEDLMKGLEVACEQFPFIDCERMGAAGASYGGYMVNWIAVHDHPFKAFVSHNGVYNMPSMYGATEELWFPEWEFGGTYYENPELYEKWSPHRLAKNLKTPMLVVHSELDFRVPLNQGTELFTALQRQGVTSRWLYFPDEDHFVGTPKNARMWWSTVLGWMDTHVKQAGDKEFAEL